MAQIIGSPSGFLLKETIKRGQYIIIILLILLALTGILEGFFISVYLYKSYLPIIGFLLPLVCLYLVYKYLNKNIEKLEKERLSFRKGAVGEHLIAGLLESNLSDDFYAINGLSTPHGDIDHVVVGPTGIFLIDTKQWRGIVKADNKGELLLNDQSTGKPEIKNFQVRVMEIRNRFLSLCNLDDVYFQPIFVFPTARVDAAWGSTRNVHCMTDEKLIDYIEKQKPSRNFMPSSAKQYVDAFEALGKFDKKV